MRILIAGMMNYASFNGQTIFTINLAEGLARQGHDVYYLTPSDQGRAYNVVRNGVHFQTIDAVNLKFWHPDIYFPPFPERMITKVFNKIRPDIVHIHDHYPMSRIIHRIARQRKIKVIGTNHFMPENLAPHIPLYKHNQALFSWLLWHWMLSLFNHLDAVTAPSKTAAEILVHEGLRVPVVPISNGVDLKRFYPRHELNVAEWRVRFGLHPHRKTFLFVGRVDGEKRLDVLIKAFALLKRDDIQLAITGKGTAYHKLKELVSSLGLEHKVIFTGFVSAADLPVILNCADIFCMPSEAELLSIATIEAMACAKPVLAAASRALPELVADDVNGYLFRPGDVEDAARCMTLFADNPANWQKMSAASLDRVQPHGLDNTVLTYQKIYEHVVAEVALPIFRPSPRRLPMLRPDR